jgi:Nucleotidyl transferase AbiEii toxin, Type IV TA system
MNSNFLTVLQASETDRRNLFLETATRLGTPLRNIEKDFWVCFTLDLLFNGKTEGEPRLLFKGGTSLSKAYDLISRFSEDIDITVYREDIGHPADLITLQSWGRNKRTEYLKEVKATCSAYILGHLKERLTSQIETVLSNAGINMPELKVVSDPTDTDQQTLLVEYPSLESSGKDSYIESKVKIEAGAKSALDPSNLMTIKPYISQEFIGGDLSVPNVTCIAPERTFWDKAVITHGLRAWFETRGSLRNNGNRISRHYYDLHMLMNNAVGQNTIKDIGLGKECALHASIFFFDKDSQQNLAAEGNFLIYPSEEMIPALRRDYMQMSTMIFGKAPTFDEIIDTIRLTSKLLQHI